MYILTDIIVAKRTKHKKKFDNWKIRVQNMKTLVTSNVFTNPESMNQAPYLSIYTWLNALFIVKKLVFRNQFFLFPDKDILSSQSLSRHSAYGRQKMHRQIEFKRFQGLLTQLSILLCFYSTALWVCEDFREHIFPHPHMCRCENVQKSYWFLHISRLHTHFCLWLHTKSRTLTWLGTKMCSRTHSLLNRHPNGKYHNGWNLYFNRK